MSTAQVVYQPFVTISPASVDGGESFPLNFTALYQTLTKIFRYTTGTPPATGFTFSVYTSESDAANLVNALSDSEVASFLEYYFVPETPAEDAIDEIAYLVTTLIAIPEEYDTLYGVICIEQDTELVPVGDPKKKPVSPIQPPRRRHYPTWEIR